VPANAELINVVGDLAGLTPEAADRPHAKIAA
jgi:hypothetical protein